MDDTAPAVGTPPCFPGCLGNTVDIGAKKSMGFYYHCPLPPPEAFAQPVFVEADNADSPTPYDTHICKVLPRLQGKTSQP